MEWQSVKKLKDKDFRRMVGVKRNTFEQMLLAIREYEVLHRKHLKRGRPPKLTVENKLLMMLMYNREYRTYMHIAVDYGISESQCWRIIDDLQNILIQSKAFSLPGKKALAKSNIQWSVVLIDVGESPVERPKKNNAVIIPAKRKGIPVKHN